MGAFRRALWVIDGAGRVFTVASVIGLAGATGVIVATVVRAVSHLPLGWLLALGASAGVLVLLAAVVVVAQVVGAGAKIAQSVNSCWASYDKPSGLVILGGSVLITNGSAQERLQAVAIVMTSYTSASGRRYRRAVAGQMARIDHHTGQGDLPPNGSAPLQRYLPGRA